MRAALGVDDGRSPAPPRTPVASVRRDAIDGMAH